MTPTDSSSRTDRLEAARVALLGLSVGDALGEAVMRAPGALVVRELPDGVHPWTDDTAMAIEIAGVLGRRERIDQDLLARAFAARYEREPHRGYGYGAHRLLTAVAQGDDWRTLSRAAFGGTGSMGNGSAMRVAPVGAFFADDPQRIVQEAATSALPTHWNDDAQAGAIAVAIAAGWAWRTRGQTRTGAQLLAHVIEHTPKSATRDGLEGARQLDPATPSHEAGRVLGNGSQVLCSDTVPFVIWSAARSLESYAHAFWETACALGDVDTTCAMVGAIVACAGAPVPAAWLAQREPLPRAIASVL